MSDEILVKIFEKVEKISDDVGDLKVTTVRQQVILNEHVAGVNTLKDMYTHMKEQDIEPIKADINNVKGVIKFVTISASLGSLITLFLKFFGLV